MRTLRTLATAITAITAATAIVFALGRWAWEGPTREVIAALVISATALVLIASWRTSTRVRALKGALDGVRRRHGTGDSTPGDPGGPGGFDTRRDAATTSPFDM